MYIYPLETSTNFTWITHMKSDKQQVVFEIYITHIYSGERDKCSALVTRNNKIRLLEQ